nr:hypothetical protein [Trichocoleus desertorum]
MGAFLLYRAHHILMHDQSCQVRSPLLDFGRTPLMVRAIAFSWEGDRF